MKLSVSVPDSLWDAVKAAYPDLSNSEIVQSAVRTLFEEYIAGEVAKNGGEVDWSFS